MASKIWKKIEKSTPYRRVKLFIRRVAGQELWLRLDVRCATVEIGGWHICPDAITRAGGLVYSFGVGKDVRFDLGLIRDYPLEIHAFDPTPSTVAWIEEIDKTAGFHFHPWAVSDLDGHLVLFPREKRNGTKSETMFTLVAADSTCNDGIEVPALSVSTILARLDHEAAELAIIKMDIEGAEYAVLDHLIRNKILPAQILIEFHHRFAGIGKKKTQDIVNRLRECGYLLFSVSATGCEVSFVHRDAIKSPDFTPTTQLPIHPSIANDSVQN